uniref:PD-(D/E)XK nuclease family transposase n=1 Tax=Fibrobacter succinogenes TaxID=833 RepID=UPI0015699B89
MKKKNTTPHKSLEDYLVKPGEQSPYANLLIDLAFKKAFDPDKPASRENLVNLLNDLLAPQLKRPIKSVKTRNVAKNLSGSKESRTAIFDLHCEDDAGNLIEIEVQIRKLKNFSKRLAFYASEMVANQAEIGSGWKFNVKPTYVIAITQKTVFKDNRIIHRATTVDLETGEQFV